MGSCRASLEFFRVVVFVNKQGAITSGGKGFFQTTVGSRIGITYIVLDSPEVGEKEKDSKDTTRINLPSPPK